MKILIQERIKNLVAHLISVIFKLWYADRYLISVWKIMRKIGSGVCSYSYNSIMLVSTANGEPRPKLVIIRWSKSKANIWTKDIKISELLTEFIGKPKDILMEALNFIISLWD